MSASIEVYSNEFSLIKTITKEFINDKEAKGWLINFNANQYVGWLHDGSFAIVFGFFKP